MMARIYIRHGKWCVEAVMDYAYAMQLAACCIDRGMYVEVDAL